MNKFASPILLAIIFVSAGCDNNEAIGPNDNSVANPSVNSTSPQESAPPTKPEIDADENHGQSDTNENVLSENQILRLFEGQWIPNWIESAKYSKNSDQVSELGHFFDDHVNNYYETNVVFFDYGITWSSKQKINSEPDNDRLKLNNDGPVNWSEHVDVIDNNRIAICRGAIWIVCDHWSTKK